MPTPAELAERAAALPGKYRDRKPRYRTPRPVRVRRGTWLHEDYTLTRGLNVSMGKHGAHLTYEEAADLRAKLDRLLSYALRMGELNPQPRRAQPARMHATASHMHHSDPGTPAGVRIRMHAERTFLTPDEAHTLMDQIEDALDQIEADPMQPLVED